MFYLKKLKYDKTVIKDWENFFYCVQGMQYGFWRKFDADCEIYIKAQNWQNRTPVHWRVLYVWKGQFKFEKLVIC